MQLTLFTLKLRQKWNEKSVRVETSVTDNEYYAKDLKYVKN